MNLEAFVRAMPKVELHVHLEGSIRPATLLTLAERNNVALPDASLDGLRALYQFTDFAHFIDTYGTVISCLRTPDDFATIAYEFGADMAAQNIRYAEVTWSPVSHVGRLGVPFGDLLAGVNRGREQARAQWGVEMRWVVDIVRNYWAQGIDGTETAQWAIEGHDAGVVALGLGGLETGFGAELFVPAYDLARAAGLHAAPHAGEAAGPESVWHALRLLGAERIGHGVRSMEDPALVRYLVDEQVPLEICPTSNLRTGVVRSIAEHPIRALWDAGAYVTVNSDDPPMFNTTLTDEYLLLVRELGFDATDLRRLVDNAASAAFVNEVTKQRLRDEIAAGCADLGDE